MTLAVSDPVIEEIREIRHRVSAECEHDTALYIERLKKIEERYRNRILQERAPTVATSVGDIVAS